MPQVILRVIKYAGRPLADGDSKVFDERGGTIGRGSTCDWVLADPNRFLSSRHAALTFEDGQFCLIDTSTNGVFINHARDPVGGDRIVPLNDGDIIALGDYELIVGLEMQVAAAATPAADLLGGRPDLADPLALLNATLPPVTPPVSAPRAPSSGPLDILDAELGSPPPRSRAPLPPAAPATQEPLDPLALLGGGVEALPEDALEPAQPYAERDDTPMVSSHFQPPRAHGEVIPEDWDDLLGPEPTETPSPPPRAAAPVQPSPPPPPATPPPRAPRAVPAPRPAVAAAPAATAMAPDAGAALEAFLRGVGVDPGIAANVPTEQALELAGQLFRLAMEGLREVLMARASLKSGFRMDVTYVAPANNNPLKFAAGGPDEVIEKLLFRRSKGYLAPVDAISEAFQDIKDHQVGMVAGLRAGFDALLQQFDPAQLEQRFDALGKRGLLSNKKAQNWEHYCEWYAELTKNPDETYSDLFGDAFAQAYQEQVRRVANLKTEE